MRKPLRIIGATIFLAFVVIGVKQQSRALHRISARRFLRVIVLHNAMALIVGLRCGATDAIVGVTMRGPSPSRWAFRTRGLGLVLIFNFFDGVGGMAVVAAGWGVWHIIAGLTHLAHLVPTAGRRSLRHRRTRHRGPRRMPPDGRADTTRRILVTGASGYIGKLTVAALAARRAGNGTPEAHEALGALVALDVADVLRGQERLRGRHLRHLPTSAIPVLRELMSEHQYQHRGAPGVDRASSHRVHRKNLAWRVDVDGTRNVLEACLMRRACGASWSPAAARPTDTTRDNPQWLREGDPLRGNADFPLRASQENRRADAGAAGNNQHPHLEQVIFRPGTVVGVERAQPQSPSCSSGAADVRHPRFAVSFRFHLGSKTSSACLLAAVFGGPHRDLQSRRATAHCPRGRSPSRLGKPYVPLPALLVGAALFVS